VASNFPFNCIDCSMNLRGDPVPAVLQARRTSHVGGLRKPRGGTGGGRHRATPTRTAPGRRPPPSGQPPTQQGFFFLCFFLLSSGPGRSFLFVKAPSGRRWRRRGQGREKSPRCSCSCAGKP